MRVNLNPVDKGGRDRSFTGNTGSVIIVMSASRVFQLDKAVVTSLTSQSTQYVYRHANASAVSLVYGTRLRKRIVAPSPCLQKSAKLRQDPRVILLSDYTELL